MPRTARLEPLKRATEKPLRQHSLALAEQRNDHLEGTVEELRARLDDMKLERDQALKEAREDRARVVALLEDQRPKSIWTRLFNK